MHSLSSYWYTYAAPRSPPSPPPPPPSRSAHTKFIEWLECHSLRRRRNALAWAQTKRPYNHINYFTCYWHYTCSQLNRLKAGEMSQIINEPALNKRKRTQEGQSLQTVTQSNQATPETCAEEFMNSQKAVLTFCTRLSPLCLNTALKREITSLSGNKTLWACPSGQSRGRDLPSFSSSIREPCRFMATTTPANR